MRSIDFFRDEVRNGFYIPTAIKQAWAATLDVLEEIDCVCEKHGIRYFADWGTFLGAVRHGGFVPWDDDLDICMLREDYDKFRAVADAELPSEFMIHDYERKENHWLFLARVVNNSKMCFDLEYLNAHNNFPWLAGVDIFIKDGLYDDEAEERARDKEVLSIIATADALREGSLPKSALEKQVADLAHKYKVNLPKLSMDEESKRALAVALYALAEKQIARVPSGSTKLVGQVFPWVLKNGHSAGESSAWYAKSVRLPFEDMTIPVPANYNEMLRSRYGNYCEIRKVWDGHDYPFFEGQKKEMEQIAGKSFMRYKFDDGLLKREAPDKSGALKTIAVECVAELEKMLERASVIAGSVATPNENGISGDMNIIDNNAAQGNRATLPAPSEEFTKLVSEMQQLAADLGTLAENVKGENAECTVRLVADLQHFCDALWEEYESSNALPSSRNALSKVKASVKENILNRKEILFLPVGPREWKAFKSYYDEAVADENTDVRVVPLPLLKKNFTGEINMSDEEIMAAIRADEYPESVELTSFADYDLALHAPERVYIQNPYDETNPCLTVPPYFYAQNIRNYADELIYVPIAPTAEFTEKDVTDLYNLSHYVTAPGTICADKVIVQSENIRERYIDALTSFAGGNTTDVWEKKIIIKECTEEKLSNKPKKNLLLCIGANELSEVKAKEKSFAELLDKKLDVIREAKGKLDVSLVLYPSDRALWEEAGKIASLAVLELLDKDAESGVFDIISLSPWDADDVACRFDAYYGSPSPFVPAFSVAGKPVMIADFNVE